LLLLLVGLTIVFRFGAHRNPYSMLTVHEKVQGKHGCSYEAQMVTFN